MGAVDTLVAWRQAPDPVFTAFVVCFAVAWVLVIVGVMYSESRKW